MNALEQEYQDNLQRVRRREDRRRIVVLGIYFAFTVVLFAVFLMRGEPPRNIIVMAPSAVIFGGLATWRLARHFLKRFEDRNVEVATTERERGYREAVVMTRDEAVIAPRKPSLLALFALIPAGVASFVIGVALHDPRDRLIPLGITLTMAGFILVGQRLYGTWRARRNARLELQWEKWLDSADSCEVRPRKWTK